MIQSAERPVVVAGGGTIISGATELLATLARAIGAPVATTSGKGAFDEFDPQSAGVVGSYTGGAGRRGRVANEVVRRADLVVLVGTATGSGSTASWTVQHPSQTIVHLDVDPQEPRRNYRASIPLVADAKLGLEAVLSAVGARSADPWAGDSLVRMEDRPFTEPAGDTGALHPAAIMAEIQRSVDDDTLVVADAGYCAAWALDALRFRAPGRRFLAPGGYGTLGYGLPAAIGAKLATPSASVVCITGDGGVGFSLAELETAARCGVGVTVVVLNNSALGWSHHYDRHFYGYEGQTRFTDVDYAAVARGLGCEGTRVTTIEAFAAAFTHAATSKATTLLDVITDPAARAPVVMFD